MSISVDCWQRLHIHFLQWGRSSAFGDLCLCSHLYLMVQKDKTLIHLTLKHGFCRASSPALLSLCTLLGSWLDTCPPDAQCCEQAQGRHEAAVGLAVISCEAFPMVQALLLTLLIASRHKSQQCIPGDKWTLGLPHWHPFPLHLAVGKLFRHSV